MKNLRFLVIFSLLSMSCGIANTVVGSLRVQSGQTTTVLASVVSPNGLRLRSLPDALGSQELTIMPMGSKFDPLYCIDARGTEWAFGVYTDKDGMAWLGYAAARYLQGACDGH